MSSADDDAAAFAADQQQRFADAASAVLTDPRFPQVLPHFCRAIADVWGHRRRVGLPVDDAGSFSAALVVVVTEGALSASEVEEFCAVVKLASLPRVIAPASCSTRGSPAIELFMHRRSGYSLLLTLLGGADAGGVTTFNRAEFAATHGVSRPHVVVLLRLAESRGWLSRGRGAAVTLSPGLLDETRRWIAAELVWATHGFAGAR